jgi:hypothetical protein
MLHTRNRYIPNMATDRRDMTVRVVPLKSRESGDGHVGGTAAERVILVGTLSEVSWARTHRPVPTYTRKTIPVAVTPLSAQ